MLKERLSPVRPTDPWSPSWAAPPPPPWPVPPLATALSRGFGGRCPACGTTALFAGYLRITPGCAGCGAPLGLARADDLPPYLTILLVGHIVVPLLFLLDQYAQLSIAVTSAIVIPLTLALTLALLRPIKGAVVGLMLRLDMLRSVPDA